MSASMTASSSSYSYCLSKKIRYSLLLFVVLACLIPLVMMAGGIDFGTRLSAFTVLSSSTPLCFDELHSALRGTLTHTILEWTSVCIAFFVGFLSVVHYRLTKAPHLIIFGLSLMCAGSMDAFHTLAAGRLIEANVANSNLVPFTWATCRMYAGVILLLGISVTVLWPNLKPRITLTKLGIAGACFILIAYASINYCATSNVLPDTMFPGAFIVRPYDLIPILPFALCLLLCWHALRTRYRSIFLFSLLLSMIPQILTQIVMAFGSANLHDSAFNVAHTFKTFSYLVPVIGIVLEYIQLFDDAQDKIGALNAHAIVAVTNNKGGIIHVNDKFCEISGYSREYLIGSNHRILNSGFHDKAFFEQMYATISRGDIWRGEICNRSKDGNLYWVNTTITPQMNSHGRIKSYIAVRADITDRKHAEQNAIESESRYARAVMGSRDGIWDWDLINKSIYYSPQWKRMLGYEEDELTSSIDAWFKHITSNHLKAFQEQLAIVIEGKTDTVDIELQMMHRDGELRWMLCRAAAIHDDAGTAIRLAGSLTDITTLRQAQNEITRLAREDALTGLPNRVVLSEQLERALCRVKRHPDFQFAIFFFDFDRFKLVNDSLGHPAGDALLTSIAERFRAHTRTTDTVTRFGGDEFVLVMEDCGGVAEVKAAATRFIDIFSQSHHIFGHDVVTTASIGIMTSDMHHESVEAMLRDADAALYEAKMQGKARYQLFGPNLRVKINKRLSMENDLRAAIDRNEFVLHYQPIINLRSGALTGFESLIRWMHPTRGLVRPDEFIPIAEETGLIQPIGELVFCEACQQMADWQSRFIQAKTWVLAVNLSRRQLLKRDLTKKLLSITESMSVSPKSIILEITESSILDEQHNMLVILEQLRECGFRLAMDDFGTGHSSLSCLHQLPVDFLKIDRSFVSRIETNRELSAIVQTIIDLAHHLRLQVVAEGIETAGQLAQLQAMDCDEAQGFYFSKPLALDALVGWITKYELMQQAA